MKKVFLFLFMLINSLASTQVDVELKRNIFGNPFVKGNQDFIRMVNHVERSEEERVQFLFDSWQPMEVVGLEEGVNMKMDSANFHIPTQQILFYHKGKILKVYENQVSYVMIGGKKIKPYFKSVDGVLSKSFFEVLYVGNISILKDYEVRKKITNSNPLGFRDGKSVEWIRKFKIMYTREDDEVKEMPKKKKKFLRVFQKKSRSIKNYLINNDLSNKNIDDIIEVCRYYDTIVNEK